MLVNTKVLDLKTKEIIMKTMEIELVIEVNKEGTVFYKHPLTGKLHRLDGPAVEYADGDKAWYSNGWIHREDGPALEYADGDKEWWVNGKRHRLDGPAVEWHCGTKMWFLNGVEYSYYNWLVEVGRASRN